MKENKNNKVYRYSNKQKQLYDNEYANDYDEENRQLELEKQSKDSFTKSKKCKTNTKKGENC